MSVPHGREPFNHTHRCGWPRPERSTARIGRFVTPDASMSEVPAIGRERGWGPARASSYLAGQEARCRPAPAGGASEPYRLTRAAYARSERRSPGVCRTRVVRCRVGRRYAWSVRCPAPDARRGRDHRNEPPPGRMWNGCVRDGPGGRGVRPGAGRRHRGDRRGARPPPAPHLHRAGEPFLRSLLRHLPGGRVPSRAAFPRHALGGQGRGHGRSSAGIRCRSCRSGCLPMRCRCPSGRRSRPHARCRTQRSG